MILDHFTRIMDEMKEPCTNTLWALGKKQVFLRYGFIALAHLMLQPAYLWMIMESLAPCIPRSSTTMVSSMKDKCTLAFHVRGFQLPVPSHYQDMTGNANTFLHLLKMKINWAQQYRLVSNIRRTLVGN